MLDKAWWRRALVASFYALLIVAVAGWRPGQPKLHAAEVTFLPVEPVADFPGAAAPDAIQYACAPQQSEIEAFFAARKLESLTPRFSAARAPLAFVTSTTSRLCPDFAPAPTAAR